MEKNGDMSQQNETLAKQRVDAVLGEAWNAMQQNDDSPYWGVDLEDRDILKSLHRRAASRSLSLADLDAAIAEDSEARTMRFFQTMEKNKKCNAVHPRKCRVYDVYNTAQKPLKVLAIDVQSARYHALQSRHVQEEKNGRVMVYKDEWHEKEMKSGSALGRAIVEGYQGVLKQVGRNIIIERWNKVYLPLSIVGEQ